MILRILRIPGPGASDSSNPWEPLPLDEVDEVSWDKASKKNFGIILKPENQTFFTLVQSFSALQKKGQLTQTYMLEKLEDSIFLNISSDLKPRNSG